MRFQKKWENLREQWLECWMCGCVWIHTYCGTSPNTPLDIAVGLAFISCIASDNFKNVALSFTDVPQVFSFAEGTSVKNRINQITSKVGYSTNYEGLHKALFRRLCVKNKVPENELPVLGVELMENSILYIVIIVLTWEQFMNLLLKEVAGYKKVL